MAPFTDRRDAGRKLGAALAPAYRGQRNTVVLGLPRGGVPVAFEVARSLAAPLDVFVVRKLGAPGQPELAMGAIASGGVRVLDRRIIELLDVTDDELEAVTRAEAAELARREAMYRGASPLVDLAGAIAILVDDGLATGSTMRAAARAVRRMDPARVVIAAPVGARESCIAMRGDADDVVCAVTPEMFRAVGLWYDDFDQTGDDEVQALLAAARRERWWDAATISSSARSPAPPGR